MPDTPPTTHTGILIVTCGLLAEARIAAGRRVYALAGSGNGRRLAVDIERAIADGGGALLSFGIAGGLAPGLAPGTVVVPNTVVSAGELFATTAGWTRRLRATLPHSVGQAVVGLEAPVATPSAKHALHAATQASAADMESHVAARAAARAGLPFAVVRVIADPAERALPRAAVAGLGHDGRPDVAAVLQALARHPAELWALMRVAADTRRAMAALRACASLLAPSFGWHAEHAPPIRE